MENVKNKIKNGAKKNFKKVTATIVALTITGALGISTNASASTYKESNSKSVHRVYRAAAIDPGEIPVSN